MNKDEKKISTLKVMMRCLGLGKFSPLYGTFIVIIGCINSVMWGVQTTITQKFFDTVNKNIGMPQGFKNVIIVILMFLLVLVLNQVLNGVLNFLGNDYAMRLTGKVRKNLNEKYVNIHAINFEKSEFLDEVNKAEQGAETSVMCLLVIFMVLTMYIPYFIYMGIYLYSMKPMFVFILLITFIPIMVNQIIKMKIFTNLEDEAAPLRREYEYYEKCICDREYFKETRILGAFGYFKNKYTSALKLLNKKTWQAQRKSACLELLMNVFSMIADLLILYMLISTVVKGEISVGAFAAILASINMIFSLMQEVIKNHIGQLAEMMGTVKNFFNFMDMPERKGEDIVIEGVPCIKVENMSFTYPGADKVALDKINLTINKGETVAVVGENGSGKTTLVKLITGLYAPNEGKVYINEYDTSKISSKSLYKSISGVFQKFQRYKMTLKENVLLSDISAIKENKVEDKVNEAMEKADLDVNLETFPSSLDTMLSREFDGVDLSGGQWQRIAIARGFFKAHHMIVLDEPTAAIDPVEETRIYNKFSEISKGKTSILVTHRLGSTKIADKIIVMDKGKIVETGTHNELINNHGKYEEMYKAQSKWYEEENVII